MKEKVRKWFFISIVLIFAGINFSYASEQKGGEVEMPRLDGMKILMIIAAGNFRDEEFLEPKGIFEKQGAKVVIASTTLKKVKGMLGATVMPDILIEKAKVEDYQAIIFVGGTGASQYWNDPLAHKIVKEAIKQGKILGAICIAPVTLANAGVLEGKKATVFESDKAELKAKGALYTGLDVQIDGNIITADGPTSATKFGETIVRALADLATKN
jgi:protease I